MKRLADCTIVIFGITGDLSRRKLIPALYELICEQPEHKFLLIGAALEDTNITEILTAARPYINNLDEQVWQKFLKIFYYVPTNLKNQLDLDKLAQRVLELEQAQQMPGSRLFYCAIAAHFFGQLAINLAKVGLLKRQVLGCKNNPDVVWHRIVFEKPFGINFKSAQNLNREILSVIDESQVFRIDHYLTKEIVENIAFIRFTNRIFEPLWNHYHIDWVQIVLSEETGLEGGIAYFDDYGTVRDVVQNHILQLIALVAMDAPKSLTGEGLYEAKAHILQHLEYVDGIFGQYQGYLSEPGIKPDSKTETFAALKLKINEPRWADVPFYIRTGKRLNQKETKICIKFKSTHCLLPKNCPTGANYLVISIYPEGGFKLHLNAKKPGVRDEVIPVTMNCCYDCLTGPKAAQVYTGLIADVIAGERAVAVHMDEIEASWQLIDQIMAHKLPVQSYVPGSFGPQELTDFADKYKFEWV